MDSTLNAGHEDKENYTPSPTKSPYPKLPQPPKSPLRSNRRITGGVSSPLLSYDQAKRPSQTPNIGRKRRAFATLINSPPRPSYADKVRGIFFEPATKLHRWDGFGRRTPSFTISNADHVRKEATPWSPLQSESEREVNWNASCDSVGSKSTSSGTAKSSKSSESCAGAEAYVGEAPSQTPASSRMPQRSPDNPLRDLEEACGSPPPDFMPAIHEHRNIPQIEEPPSVFDESSDSWTGDDEFLPRSVRRQKRIDRKLDESPKHPPIASSTQLLRPQAPTYTSPNYPWPTALSKPSRFRAATPLALYPELSTSPVGAASDHRASDADDEDSNSP